MPGRSANLVGSKLIYQIPGNTLWNTANLAATDTPCTSLDVYPYTHTATLATQFSERNHYTITSGAAMASGQKMHLVYFCQMKVLIKVI